MSTFPIKTVLLSSLHRVFPDNCPNAYAGALSAMKNEPYSFQMAYRLESGSSKRFNLRVETDLPISVYSVEYVPVSHTGGTKFAEQYKPGLFPDMLLPKTTNPKIVYEGFPWSTQYFEKDEKVQLAAVNDSWRALWFTVNENGKNIPAGKHRVALKLFDRETNAQVGESDAEIHIIDARLPKQKTLYTNWFHCDCLCDTYDVALFSERFWKIFQDFAAKAAKNGMNMILLPAFTPPLDTPIGSERMTVQLVKITKENGKYSFDFSRMKQYIDVCRKVGIDHFEHAHLFTQWGAKAAPKIMGYVNGKEKRLFGWNTPADSPAYAKFIRAYLTAVKAFLAKEGLSKKVLFHISDEPTAKSTESYRRAKAVIGNLLDGYMLGDALSHYEYFADGTVPMPIPATSRVADFVGRCDHFWCYYAGNPSGDGYSQRNIVNTCERNRMIGVQMYCNKVEGFLHWGYNYYYSVLSHGLFDPKINPCGYDASDSAAGAGYCVYPASDGTAIQSIRQKVFFEGLIDIRALQLLEQKRGRKFAMALVEKHFGAVTFCTAADSPEHLLRFRKEVNDEIARAISAERI